MSVSLSVMALRELPFGRFRMPRRHEVTHEEATDAMNDSWVLNYEREGVAIRDVLAIYSGAYSSVRFRDIQSAPYDHRLDLHVL